MIEADVNNEIPLTCACCGMAFAILWPTLEAIHQARCQSCPEICETCGKCAAHCEDTSERSATK